MDNFKTKKRRKARPEELMIFRNTHEAIIDEETWNNAQRLKKTVRRKSISKEQSKTATELAFAEVINYNRKNLERELANMRVDSRTDSRAK